MKAGNNDDLLSTSPEEESKAGTTGPDPRKKRLVDVEGVLSRIENR